MGSARLARPVVRPGGRRSRAPGQSPACLAATVNRDPAARERSHLPRASEPQAAGGQRRFRPELAERYTSPITRTGHLRASDADRDQVAERLRAAAAEGRIGFDELEERLGGTLAARTYGELEAMVADLPSLRPERRRTLIPASPVARVGLALAIAVPIMVAAIFVVTAFLSAWIVWVLVGWYVFGHRGHHRHYRRHARLGHSPRHDYRQAGAGAGRGFWA